jgi:hypothetical protein
MIRPADQLTPDEIEAAARIERGKASMAKRIKDATELAERRAFERAESLLREASLAQSAEHQKDIDRIARLWRSNAAHMGQARLAIGALLGAITGMALGWLAHDIGLDRAFEAASDATARGALIGSVQRAAEGKEP